MIIAYYMDNEKYLQKDDYKKNFEVNSLKELISKIKNNNETILIKAKKEDIFEFQFKSGIVGDFEYEIISDKVEFNEQSIIQDLYELNKGIRNYVKYSVRTELQDRIGKIVYLTKNKDIKEYIMKNSNDLAIEVNELREFHNKVMSNDKSYIVKLMFDGSEVE